MRMRIKVGVWLLDLVLGVGVGLSPSSSRLIAQDATEDGHVVILVRVAPYAVEAGVGVLEYERLEAILGVEARVQVLLHGLARQLGLSTPKGV